MASAENQPNRNIFTRVFISPDEPRLRAGWRLLLHTILLGFISSGFILILLFLPAPTWAGSLDTSLLALCIEFISIMTATWLARRYLDRRNFRSLGFNLTAQSWQDLIVGFAIPGMLLGLIFVLELALGWTRFDGWIWQETHARDVLVGLLSGFLGFVLVGMSEELLSRGYHLQNLHDGLNLNWAILVSSGIFAVFHAANPESSWISTFGILLAGVFLAYGWVRTRQLWLSIGLHIGWNFFEGTIFGFPVSGLSTLGLIRHTTTGPEIFTGGGFGPEAGIIVIPAMALGILFINFYTRNRLRSEQTPNKILINQDS